MDIGPFYTYLHRSILTDLFTAVMRKSVECLPLFFILLFTASPGLSSVLECAHFYGLDIRIYTVPTPGHVNQNIQAGDTSGNISKGFIHDFKLLDSREDLARQFGSFESIVNRIKHSPKWLGLFGMSSPSFDHLKISDIAFISEKTKELRNAKFPFAPTLLPQTYSGKGEIKSLDLIKLLAQGHFVVATENGKLWRHDIFDHGFPGYMLMPPFVTQNYIRYAQLLVALHKDQNITGALRSQVNGEIERLAGEIDELSQGISKSIRDNDHEYLNQIISRYLIGFNPHWSRFSTAIKSNLDRFTLANLPGLNDSSIRPFSTTDVTAFYNYAINAYSGHWAEPN